MGSNASLLHRDVPASPAVFLSRTTGSPQVRPQRARLWELSESVHCSVIGTCLTTSELRRVMGKVCAGDVAGVSDHDLHSQAVGLCVGRNAGSRLLQKALDQRHQVVVKRFARLLGEPAVLDAWSESRREGDIPGAYWAVLTHPDVGHAGLRRAFGDVHMLSHLVGAANRADIRRLTALEAENAALRAKVERQQARLQEAVGSRDKTIRQLGALAAVRAGEPSGDGEEDASAGLRHLVADLQSRLDRETARHGRLERRAAEAVEAARQTLSRAEAAEETCAAMAQELSALESARTSDGAVRAVPAMTVLYVGGRPGAIEQMRAVLADAGGALLMHDGGRHDHPSLLAGLVGQAELVAFPVDCVSHDAALTVKRLCRQQSKPWAALRSSGLGSFLAMLSGDEPPRAAVRSGGA